MASVEPHKLEYSQWLQALQLFLNDLLKPIIPVDAERFRILTPASMKIWADAFTHETFDPTNNYEDLEFFGDEILEYVFAKYLIARFPNLHKKEYTELKVSYMSKMRQASMSHQMGLGRYVRVAGLDRVILNIEADVFESIFGALETTSDLVQPGWGAINCYNLIIHLYGAIDISETGPLTEGASKTQVIQMFVRFELPAPVERSIDGKPGIDVSVSMTPLFNQILQTSGYNVPVTTLAHSKSPKEKDARNLSALQTIDTLEHLGLISRKVEKVYPTGRRGVEFTVSLTKDHLDFLRENSIDIKDPVIGRGFGNTKREADYNAYENAIATLASYGVTTQWAGKVKKERDFKDPAIARYVPAAMVRAKTEGYTEIYFSIPRKTIRDEGAAVLLTGVYPNGQAVTIDHIDTPDRSNSYREAKTYLIRKYAEFG